MLTELEVKNYALALVGAEAITSTTDDKRSRLCDIFYDTVRDSLLRDHNWNFAVTTVEVTPVASIPDAEEEVHGTKYTLPSNCVRVIKMENYDYEYLTAGSFLYADIESELIISYIRNDLTVPYYTPDFTKLLCLSLAVELSYPLVQSGELHDRLFAKYERTIKDVRFNNAVEKSNTTYAGDSFTNSRLG